MSVMNQKPSEAGWFYHAPAKKPDNVEPVGAPPASQIPGLGDISVLPPEQPKEMVFRDTDSKYIRMAKMGGRKDLLTIRPNSGTKREPKGYPRSEWFYLEDNAQQERANQSKDQEPWKFMLPEYMVHQSVGETALPEESRDAPMKGVPMRRAPYATDQPSQLAGEGRSMKPPMTKGQGCDTHKAKATSREAKSEKNQLLNSQLSNQPRPSELEEPTNMTKLLAYTYQREWHEKHKEKEDKQAKAHAKAPTLVSKRPEQDKTNVKPPAASQRTERNQNSDANNNQVATARKPTEVKKEPFKLGRFKNVSAHLDTRRSTEVCATKGK